MRSVRIMFSKTGRIKYISHLDMMRAFTLAIRRTDLPVWFTEGYNPRPYLDFPRPLALGIEGLRELLDVRMTDDTEFGIIRDHLDAVMPEGLQILRVYEPVSKTKDIAFALYEAEYDNNLLTEDMARTALASGELKCEKRGKTAGRKVIKEIDLTPYTTDCEVRSDENGTFIRSVLPCSTTENINILNICEGISRLYGEEVRPDNAVRLSLLDADKREIQ